MSQKLFFSVAGTLFLIITVIHLLRILNNWPVSAGTLAVPMWVSWVGMVFFGLLSYQGLKKR